LVQETRLRRKRADQIAEDALRNPPTLVTILAVSWRRVPRALPPMNVQNLFARAGLVPALFVSLFVVSFISVGRTDVPVDWNAPWPKRTSPGLAEAKLNYAPGVAPKYWSVATAETIMARYPDYRTAYWKPWTYVHGYAFRAFELLYRATNDKRYLNYIRRYVDQFVDEKGNYSGDKLTNLDNIMTGSSVVALYEYTHEERYKVAAAEFRKAFDHYPRNADGGFWHGNTATGQMWIDGVFMGQMFLLRYGRSIGDATYCYDEATKQITIFAQHGLKEDSGLYYHAWTERPNLKTWADPKTGLSPEVWSEGLGWYGLILVEALETLPVDHPKRAEIQDIFKRLAIGLKRAQDPNTGAWFMIVDRPDTPGNWTDPSGTGMFVYAIQRGIELGLLEAKEFAPVVAAGYRALIGFARVNERGLVDVYGGGDGISVKPNYEAYVTVPRTVNAKEAVIGFLWATAITERPALEKIRR
jgi:unsaturated rhamnogalacturonyl hydrolase